MHPGSVFYSKVLQQRTPKRTTSQQTGASRKKVKSLPSSKESVANLLKMRQLEDDSVAERETVRKQRIVLAENLKNRLRIKREIRDLMDTLERRKARLRKLRQIRREIKGKIEKIEADLLENERSMENLRFWGNVLTLKDFPGELLLILFKCLDFPDRFRLRR